MSEEIRVKNATTGGEKGQKLERFDLIPAGPLRQIARHYGVGARKYADRNWEKGYDWSLSYGALQRHLNAFWDGEDFDNHEADCAEGCVEHTESHHLAAAGFHVLALLEFFSTHPELDNRPATIAAREEAEKMLSYVFPQRYMAGVPQDDSFKYVGWVAEGGPTDPEPMPNVFNQTTTFMINAQVPSDTLDLLVGRPPKSTGRVSVRKILKALEGLVIYGRDSEGDMQAGLHVTPDSIVTVVTILDALEDAGYEVTYQGTPPARHTNQSDDEAKSSARRVLAGSFVGVAQSPIRAGERTVLTDGDEEHILETLRKAGLKVVKA